MADPGPAVLGKPLEVSVNGGSIEKAMRRLKRQVMNEGVMWEVRRRRFYEKPSLRRKRKARNAERRRLRKAKLEFRRPRPLP